jgi:hypothetical protein
MAKGDTNKGKQLSSKTVQMAGSKGPYSGLIGGEGNKPKPKNYKKGKA